MLPLQACLAEVIPEKVELSLTSNKLRAMILRKSRVKMNKGVLAILSGNAKLRYT